MVGNNRFFVWRVKVSLSENTPVLIGFGQVTKRPLENGWTGSPAQIMSAAIEDSIVDTGVSHDSIISSISDVVIIDTMHSSMENLPATIARDLNIQSARLRLAPVSGHVPQVAINRVCEEIVQGRATTAVVAGGEALRSARALIKSGKKPYWDGVSGNPELMFERKPFASSHEKTHGVWLAKDVYPLYETALRHHYGNSVEAHEREMGELWSGFSAVAAQNAHAWFPLEKTAAEIVSQDNGNRMVSYPYTKSMTAMNQVDQAAGVIITSIREAKRLGVDSSKWIFLHATAEAHEQGFITERSNYHSSPAIREMGVQVLDAAKITIDDVEFIDLYSCFPCAVELSRDALGIRKDDARPLTVTGGLSFGGGPGGSYMLTALVAMAKKLRQSVAAKGLITANGGLVGEHAVGIYSCSRPLRQPSYDVDELTACQQKVNCMAVPKFEEQPLGTGVVEAYTVVYGRDGKPSRVIVIGRLNNNVGARFVANTPAAKQLFLDVQETDFVGRHGSLSQEEGINIFSPFKV